MAEVVDISCLILSETDKAVRIDDGERQAWVPLSQVEIERVPGSSTAVVTMPVWLATEKGFV
jgi:hypothetical protein